MSLSQPALQAVLAQTTNKVFLECLTISHTDLASDILLVNNTQDLSRTAGTFVAFPFRVTGMRQAKNQLPTMRIIIDNVDQRVIEDVRGLSGTRTDITIKYEVVLADSPNTIEYGPVSFRVDNVNVNPATLSFDLSFHSGFLNAAFPAGQFAPSNAA